ncbi:MAG: hypothetical protein COB04_08395 [Gammaproteobacteria bacterium]|nr:MAG: hypothetical protein COB04_08395 [Gammaproteobacteria bacterium]
MAFGGVVEVGFALDLDWRIVAPIDSLVFCAIFRTLGGFAYIALGRLGLSVSPKVFYYRQLDLDN